MGEVVVEKLSNSFSGLFRGVSCTEGCIDLSVLIGEGKDKVRKITKFVVVDGSLAYNEILRRPYIHDRQDVPSTYHR